MVEEPASQEGLKPPVTLQTKEAPSAKGLIARYSEAKRRFQDAEHNIKEEFDLQTGQFSEWAKRQVDQSGIVRSSLMGNNMGVYPSTKLEGDWAVEGEGKKHVGVRFRVDSEGGEHFSRIDVKDEGAEGSSLRLSLGVPDFLRVSSDKLSRQLVFRKGEMEYQQETKGKDISVPDILDSSREVLNFFEQSHIAAGSSHLSTRWRTAYGIKLSNKSPILFIFLNS